MDVIRDAILVGGKLTALNLPGGPEILQYYADIDHAMVQSVVLETLAEVYCSYPHTFPTHGVLVRNYDTNLMYIAIRDHGRFGAVASAVLSHSEIEPNDRGKLVVREYDPVRSATIPLDIVDSELTVGSTVTWNIYPNVSLIVSDASGIDKVPELAPRVSDERDSFVPLLVYSLPVYNLNPPVRSRYIPHIPLAVVGYISENE